MCFTIFQWISIMTFAFCVCEALLCEHIQEESRFFFFAEHDLSGCHRSSIRCLSMHPDRHKLWKPTVSHGISSLSAFWQMYLTPRPLCPRSSEIVQDMFFKIRLFTFTTKQAWPNTREYKIIPSQSGTVSLYYEKVAMHSWQNIPQRWLCVSGVIRVPHRV